MLICLHGLVVDCKAPTAELVAQLVRPFKLYVTDQGSPDITIQIVQEDPPYQQFPSIEASYSTPRNMVYDSKEVRIVDYFGKGVVVEDKTSQVFTNYGVGPNFLQEAFFMIALEKFSYSPRKRIMNPKKIYLLDTGFSMLATNFSENKGKILENRVAVELYRREKQMYYHKGSYECDFIIMDGTKPYEAVQVCWQLDDTTSTRELRGLAEAVSAYSINRARILTYNQEMTITHAGITVAVEPVWKWLLNE